MKLITMIRKGYVRTKAAYAKAGAATAVALASAPALAAGPDFSELTDSIDFSTVVTGIMAIAGAIALVYVAWKGAKMILAAIRGG